MADQVTTQTQNTGLPNWAGPYMGDILGRSLALSYTPYQAFPGQRLEDFTSLQNQSFGRAASMQAPQFGPATNLANQAGIGALNTGAWTDPGVASSYMSPYTQNVVDIQNQELMRTGQMMQGQNAAKAVQANAFGGSRHGLVDAELQRNLMQQANQNQLAGQQAAYNTGIGAFQSDRNAQLQGYGAATQAAGTLGSLGTQQYAADRGIAELQNQFGAQQQALGQAGRNIDYQNFQSQQQHPYNQLTFANNMMRGNTGSNTTSTSTTQEGRPSTVSQITGLGLAGLGLWNLWNNP